jgi:hypothetical protein
MLGTTVTSRPSTAHPPNGVFWERRKASFLGSTRDRASSYRGLLAGASRWKGAFTKPQMGLVTDSPGGCVGVTFYRAEPARPFAGASRRLWTLPESVLRAPRRGAWPLCSKKDRSNPRLAPRLPRCGAPSAPERVLFRPTPRGQGSSEPRVPPEGHRERPRGRRGRRPRPS